MFDVAFSELLIIAIVALVVIGPERLPKVARTAGHLLGRLQRYVNDIKADISREMQLEELKKLQAQFRESARSLEENVSRELRETEASLQKVAGDSVASTSESSTTQTAAGGASGEAKEALPRADGAKAPSPPGTAGASSSANEA